MTNSYKETVIHLCYSTLNTVAHLAIEVGMIFKIQRRWLNNIFCHFGVMCNLLKVATSPITHLADLAINIHLQKATKIFRIQDTNRK